MKKKKATAAKRPDRLAKALDDNVARTFGGRNEIRRDLVRKLEAELSSRTESKERGSNEELHQELDLFRIVLEALRGEPGDYLYLVDADTINSLKTNRKSSMHCKWGRPTTELSTFVRNGNLTMKPASSPSPCGREFATCAPVARA